MHNSTERSLIKNSRRNWTSKVCSFFKYEVLSSKPCIENSFWETASLCVAASQILFEGPREQMGLQNASKKCNALYYLQMTKQRQRKRKGTLEWQLRTTMAVQRRTFWDPTATTINPSLSLTTSPQNWSLGEYFFKLAFFFFFSCLSHNPRCVTWCNFLEVSMQEENVMKSKQVLEGSVVTHLMHHWWCYQASCSETKQIAVSSVALIHFPLLGYTDH